MKRNVLALSITAALVGFGYAGGAQAIGLASGVLPASGTAVSLVKASDGVGHYLHVPYYSAQSGNNTMINLVNTDSVNAKAVKVRFRGAANSDDFFDFQVFLSPNDVWTMSISQDANGNTRLNSLDTSCTKPARGAASGAIDGTLNGTSFRTDRLFNEKDAAWRTNQTREGYVEIFNMADIPPNAAAGSLFQSVLHTGKSGNPKAWSTAATDPAWGGGCSSASFTALDTDPADVAAATAMGLATPTNGLFANWIILNANDAGAWSGASPAMVAVDANGIATAGALLYFPQLGTQLTGAAAANLANFTADGWLIKYNTKYASYFDLPDFSTPYVAGNTPGQQATNISAALATLSLSNEYLTLSGINATTDWVLSMPTRRYFTQLDYAMTSGNRQLFSAALGVTGLTPYFSSLNTTVVDNQICVTGVSSVSYDQEEYVPTGSQPGPIISPRNPTAPSQFLVCGEASVLAFNHGETASSSGLITSASGSLKATVARSAIDNGNDAGWTLLLTPGNSNIGLPIVGYSAERATNTKGTFGATLPHRTNYLIK